LTLAQIALRELIDAQQTAEQVPARVTALSGRLIIPGSRGSLASTTYCGTST
jgi:hypothetical protein